MLAPRKTLWSTPGVGVEAACQLLRLGAQDKVIDVGCGDGRFLLEAAKRGAHAVGLEIDAERAAAARANSICFGGRCSQATPKTSASLGSPDPKSVPAPPKTAAPRPP